jgi:hypothetical protein
MTSVPIVRSAILHSSLFSFYSRIAENANLTGNVSRDFRSSSLYSLIQLFRLYFATCFPFHVIAGGGAYRSMTRRSWCRLIFAGLILQPTPTPRLKLFQVHQGYSQGCSAIAVQGCSRMVHAAEYNNNNVNNIFQAVAAKKPAVKASAVILTTATGRCATVNHTASRRNCACTALIC